MKASNKYINSKLDVNDGEMSLFFIKKWEFLIL